MTNNDQDSLVELEPVSINNGATAIGSQPVRSNLSSRPALKSAQLIQLVNGEGSILFYPKRVDLEVGDVLFLRERTESAEVGADGSSPNSENGIVAQIVSLGTANYPQADTKALFRLMVNVRASMLQRTHNEPKEIIDEFLVAEFKVRAEIIDGEWRQPEGHVVTRNVDIFWLEPSVLSEHIFTQIDGLNVKLGEYKGAPVEFFGGGFEKINLITGMKGSGKSHIAKGIISESLKAGMSAVVFDINNEYGGLPDSARFVPRDNLKFRLDRIPPRTFLGMISRIATMGEKTGQIVSAELPGIIKARQDAGHVPDIPFLRSQANNIIRRGGEAGDSMRASFQGALSAVERHKLIMSEGEALAEDKFMKSRKVGKQAKPLEVVSLSSVLFNIEHTSHPGVVIFDIGGMLPFIQFTVVDLIIETLKEISAMQARAYKDGKIDIPNYPTIYFEEAHMYMEERVIDELLPLIRHHGMNVFFITNTPGALPESVFRLMDNLVMTRMLNKRDIDQVKNCGLTDVESIEGFARNLKTHHALLLSGLKGTTNNFPAVFHVRDFGLPKSGETRSMWQAMKARVEGGANLAATDE